MEAMKKRLTVAALFSCLVVPAVFFALLKSSSQQLAILNLQLSIRTYVPLSTVQETRSPAKPGVGITSLPALNEEIQERNKSLVDINKEIQHEKYNRNTEIEVDIEMVKLPSDRKEERRQRKNISVRDFEMTKLTLNFENTTNQSKHMDNNVPKESSHVLNEEQGQSYPISYTKMNNSLSDLKENEELTKPTTEESIVRKGEISCNLSEPRSDTCTMLGDIRILNNFTIILASPSRSSLQNSSQKIRPYARKWEPPVMQQIRELTLKSSPIDELTPQCSVNHSVPAVVFSTGGFLGNFFHDFTDVLVPLFITSHHLQGEVQFLVTDFNSIWINKYQPVLKQLSRYKIINTDTDKRVHCFTEARVGLKSHKVLGIDPLNTPNGYSMIDFRRFLRTCFSLNKGFVKRIAGKSRKKPRLLMVLRRGSRSLTNAKEVVAMARAVGFKVVTAGPEDTKDVAKFARVVNACDVMMGVHGAGLTNMVFLPANATLIQIIPWGGLKWACRHDFGEPAPDMGLNYVEYEIKEEESSLIDEYPRDHAVFRDPVSIHRQGWNTLWSVFLNKQKVKLDVGRFREVLQEIYHSIKQ